MKAMMQRALVVLSTWYINQVLPSFFTTQSPIQDDTTFCTNCTKKWRWENIPNFLSKFIESRVSTLFAVHTYTQDWRSSCWLHYSKYTFNLFWTIVVSESTFRHFRLSQPSFALPPQRLWPITKRWSKHWTLNIRPWKQPLPLASLQPQPPPKMAILSRETTRSELPSTQLSHNPFTLRHIPFSTSRYTLSQVYLLVTINEFHSNKGNIL